jgi:hypothetical protein
MILKMGLPVNSAFRQKIHLIQSLQKSEAAKMKLKQIIGKFLIILNYIV